MIIERKSEIFLLISLSVRIVVIHLRRQKQTENDEQRVAYYSRGGPTNYWQVRENGVKVLRNQ